MLFDTVKVRLEGNGKTVELELPEDVAEWIFNIIEAARDDVDGGGAVEAVLERRNAEIKRALMHAGFDCPW